MKIFFNSSMPRSGSTLLQNILGQNPEMYVSPTSGLLELLHGARVNFTASPEFRAEDSDTVNQAFIGFCKGGLIGYYKSITDKKYVIDKSRGWAINFNFLNSFFPSPKIVCMVRDLRSILASFERLEQSSGLFFNKNVDNINLKNTTIIKRTENRLLTPPVGLAINRIYDILNQNIKKSILFIKYEDLSVDPKKEIQKIYQFFELDYFDHNFNSIKQITKEDDEIYGIRNLHTIKERVEPDVLYFKETLGEELSNKVYLSFKWYFDYFNYGL